MGFFSKIFKGVKKVFKKIGKGVKSVFKGIGKFMNKIGVVGQIALMFIPGIGPMLGGLMKGLGGVAATALNALGPAGAAIVNGAKFVIGKASAFAGAAKNAFRTVTQGVKTFASEFTKTALNKIGFDPTKFGWSEGGSFDSWLKSGADQTFGDAWNKVTTNITDNASKILDPLRSSVKATSSTTLESLSDSTYKTTDELRELNPNIRDWNSISEGTSINLDPDNITPFQSFTPISELSPQVGQRSLLEYDPNTAELVGGDATITTPSLFDPKFTDPSSPDFISEGATGVFPERTVSSVTDAVTDTGGGSLLAMPSLGDVAGQTAVSVGSQMITGAIAGEAPEPYGGGFVVDAGGVPVAPAAQQQNFMQVAYDPYVNNRDPQGSFGYGLGNNNTYAQYMRSMGMA